MDYILHNGFYGNPPLASDTISLKQLKQLMLATSGQFIARGAIWTIHHKRLCPGVYTIWAEKKKYENSSHTP